MTGMETPSTATATPFTILPPYLRQTLAFQRDVLIAMVNLAAGRLLPLLPVPPTGQNLQGKTAIVTGSNSGIGLQLASDLARQGATVILACRSMERARTAISTLTVNIPEAADRVTAMHLDTSSLSSVRTFAEAWKSRPGQAKRIDILCHNAGVASTVGGNDLTPEGIEFIYATNFLGSFLLTHLLESNLSPTARVVLTASTAQYGTNQFSNDFSPGPVRGAVEQGFHCPVSRVPILGWRTAPNGSAGAYSNSKSMQCAFTRLLQRKWDREAHSQTTNDKPVDDNPRRTVHVFTPGYTSTPIFDKMEIRGLFSDPLFQILKAATAFATDVDQGAATGSWLASTTDVEVQHGGGRYWDRMTRRLCSADTFSDELLERLWSRWEKDAGVVWR